MTQCLNLKGQKILITGASGFIGSHLCNCLYDGGAEVHGISRYTQENNKTCSRWWQDDLMDMGRVRKLLVTIKPDVIFHLASNVVGARDLEFVLPTFQDNLVTTVNLLTAATEIGCRRIVLAGSLEEPELNEVTPVPCSPYAAAKWASSAYARMFHTLYQTPVTIARLFMVYGPGQKDLNKLIPYVTLSVLRKQAPKLTSGHRQIDWIYVGDVINGLIAMAQTPNVEGCIIDLGSGELVSISDIVKQLINMIDSNVEILFGAIPNRPMEQVRVANVTDTFARIGWKPTVSLDKGLEYTIDWYRKSYQKS